MHAEDHDALFQELTPTQQTQFSDNHSIFSWQWLRAIPQNKFTILTPYQVGVGLSQRTLNAGHNVVCRLCARLNELGHDEVCTSRSSIRSTRHEGVKKSIALHVAQIRETEVVLEKPQPRFGKHPLRTDIKIQGEGSFQQAASEYDVHVTSLFAQAAQKCWTENPKDIKEAKEGYTQALDKAAEFKIKKYKAICKAVFHPVIFSAGGGSLSTGTEALFDFWWEKMHRQLYESLVLSISVGLLRAKAICFAL